MKTNMTQWAEDRVKQIKKDCAAKYGRGWHLLSDDQRRNALASECFYLLSALHEKANFYEAHGALLDALNQPSEGQA